MPRKKVAKKMPNGIRAVSGYQDSKGNIHPTLSGAVRANVDIELQAYEDKHGVQDEDGGLLSRMTIPGLKELAEILTPLLALKTATKKSARKRATKKAATKKTATKKTATKKAASKRETPPPEPKEEKKAPAAPKAPKAPEAPSAPKPKPPAPKAPAAPNDNPFGEEPDIAAPPV